LEKLLHPNTGFADRVEARVRLIEGGQLGGTDEEFAVLQTTERSQVAVMVLQPGAVSGEYGNEHPESDQILHCVSGEGSALVDGEEVALQPGDTLVISAGEPHQIRCTGERPLRTLNVYSPPAY
jgi:mannose-6-phosphate isomerase-like protein (cupin superfamily)